jgi:anti-sigma factor RsiW
MARVDDVMLMAYADGELDAATARQIEAAIAADPALAARVRLFRESAALLRGAFGDALHEEVPERLRAAVQPAKASAEASNVVSLSARRPARQIVAWAVAASFAALVLGGGGTYWYLANERAASDGLQLASSDRWLDHVAGFYDVYDVTFKKEDRLLVDFKADDIPELTKWFSQRLNRELSVPDLSAQGFEPQGGRLLIINGRPAAQLLYMSSAGELVGLVIAFTTGDYQPARTVRRHNVNIVHWRNAGYAYAFVGTLDTKRLQQLADKAWRDLGKV